MNAVALQSFLLAEGRTATPPKGASSDASLTVQLDLAEGLMALYSATISLNLDRLVL